MERFVPNYTCKRVEETGFICFKALTDYALGAGVYERRVNDYSSFAENQLKIIEEKSPWKVPIIYDFAELAIGKGLKVLIVKSEDSHVKDARRNIEGYSKELRESLLKQGLKEKIDSDSGKALINVLKKSPVMIQLSLNELYKQRNAGIGWVIITEYNAHNNEFIVYDPMYYARLPRNRNWIRLPNTPKKRFISFSADYLIRVWYKTKDTTLIFKEDVKKKGFKPFLMEFIAITKKDI